MNHLSTSLSQKWKDFPLQTKYTLIIIFTVTIPFLLIAISFSGRMYQMVTAETIRQEQLASSKTAPEIDDIVAGIKNSMNSFMETDYYRRFFSQPANGSITAIENTIDKQSFINFLKEQQSDSLSKTFRIYADIPDDTFFDSTDSPNLILPSSKIEGTYWHGIFHASKPKELFCPPFYLGTEEKNQHGDLAYIRSSTIYYKGNAYPAYIVLYYNSAYFRSLLTDMLSLQGSVSYLVNERNNAVVSTNEALSGIYWLNYDVIKNEFMASNNFMERTILNEKVYAGYYNISDPEWFLVTILPARPIYAKGSSLMLKFVLLYISVLIVALLLGTALSKSVTNRISSVIEQMHSVRMGPPVAVEQASSKDEIGELIDTYNYMTQEMNHLLVTQAQAAEDLRIAEFNSLQAQINPHFLYNTMDMINWMATQGKTNDISSAVQNLSRFYRLTLSKRESITTIAQEAEHVSIYAAIQNMRFHDQIEFILDIPDELYDYQIPKLTFQPVVENAIIHGILEKASKSGTIVLTGWMEDQDIVLLISDDGVGISENILSSILDGNSDRKSRNDNKSRGSNIAVYNTHRRLQILYGKKYGLSYSSKPGEGTEVQIRLPAVRTTDHSAN